MSATIGSAPGSCGDRLPPPSFTGPTDYVGPLSLPGGRRMVWWTGRVAIGLLHEPHRPTQTSGGDWLQALLLREVSAAAQAQSGLTRGQALQQLAVAKRNGDLLAPGDSA